MTKRRATSSESESEQELNPSQTSPNVRFRISRNSFNLFISRFKKRARYQDPEESSETVQDGDLPEEDADKPESDFEDDMDEAGQHHIEELAKTQAMKDKDRGVGPFR